jgi:ADP-ribose pyrophosphatase
MNQIDALTETCVSTTLLAKSDFIEVRHDKVQLTNGHIAQREYVVHPGAVLIVPLLDNGELVLERQFRYPMRQAYIEFPAGKIDAGEDPLVTGQRELFEETGYSAQNWQYLTAIHPCIGYSNEVIHIYLATGLTAGKAQLDEDEQVQVFTMSVSAMLEAMRRGEILDGKTMLALFWLDKHLQSGW